ncbi:MAG: CHAT domain-containing protein, partial [bacterium]
MTEASHAFARVGSPYVSWAPIYRAIVAWTTGAGQTALQELARVSVTDLPTTYFHLRGRIEWTRAMAFETMGRFDLARTSLGHAISEFRQADEIEYLAVNEAYAATADWFLGERQSMWTHELMALSHLNALPPTTRRTVVLRDAALFALGDELPEAALALQNAAVDSVESPGQRALRADAYMRRAGTLKSLGDAAGAAADVEHADLAIAAVPDERMRAWGRAELSKIRAEIVIGSDPHRALIEIDSALRFYETMSSAVRRSELLVLRAKAFVARGELSNAASSFRAAIDALQDDRTRLVNPQDRKQAFEQQRKAFRAAVEFEATTLSDSAEALRMAEQGRARGDTAKAVNPAADYGQIPDHVAVLYYATLSDRVLGWVITRTGCLPFVVPLSATDLDAAVKRFGRLVRYDAPAPRFREEMKTLGSLLPPTLTSIPNDDVIVFVVDGSLSGVPFGAILDEHRQPLIVRHPVLMAPSLSSFLIASARLADFVPDDVLSIGDGHHPESSGLPRLPRANEEATIVAGLYPRSVLLTGDAATARRVFSVSRSIIHFAGHTIVNEEFPFLSRILLAPDPHDGDSGEVLASQIATQGFKSTKVVV